MGQSTFEGTLSLEHSIDCWQQVTIALNHHLGKLCDVEYSFRSPVLSDAGVMYDALPRADAVLFWGVPQNWQRFRRGRLARATGCQAIVTICETAIEKDADWRFSFTNAGPLTTRIDAPVWHAIYRQNVKCSRTVLIDHSSGNGPLDWTHRIEAWLQPLAAEFAITRYQQDEDDPDAPDQEANICPAPHVRRTMRRVPFTMWLAQTDHLETFIVTHLESYGYALLDMFARGTRVLCPAPLVPPHFGGRFHIDTFECREDLVGLLRRPPDPAALARNRAGLTDWSDVATMIDARVRWLLHLSGATRL